LVAGSEEGERVLVRVVEKAWARDPEGGAIRRFVSMLQTRAEFLEEEERKKNGIKAVIVDLRSFLLWVSLTRPALAGEVAKRFRTE
jgi:hypothetical protein